VSRTRRLSFIGVAAITLSLLAPGLASATHSWGGYHWARTANPFTLKLGDNVSSAWDSYLATTSSDWSVSSVLDTTIVPGSTRSRICKPTSGRVEVCNAAYGNTGWLGVATISITGGVHITKGSVKLNDTYFSTSTYNTPAWRNMVTCQEVGHTLGLDHQDTNFSNTNLGTCMDYTSNPLGPLDNEHPNAHDYEQLEAIYAHLDSTTTVAAAAPGGSSAADAADWGVLVASSQGGHLSTFVKDLGAGELIVTFVIWA
jgi:hypothetical protein